MDPEKLTHNIESETDGSVNEQRREMDVQPEPHKQIN